MSNITKLVQSLSKTVQNEEKLAIPLLSSKLNKLAEMHPYDQTIVMAADVLDKMGKKQLFITRAEFKDIYKRLYSRNTKFASFLSDELGEVQTLATPTMYEKHEAPITNIYEGNSQVLASAFSSAIDKNVPLQMYSTENANKALSYVGSSLDTWNIKSSKTSIANGNEHFILVRADYETPKGVASVFVPVEVEAGKVLQPSVFIGSAGLTELNHQNVKEHILAQVKKTTAEKSHSGIVGMPKAAETDKFADKFNTALGVANFKFGSDKVNLGRDAVVRCLAGFGISHPEIKVVDAQENGLVFGVSVGHKVSFKVPVKLANNKVLSPEVLICNGATLPLTKSNVNMLMLKNESDYGVAASVSTLSTMKPNELIEAVKSAADEHNYAKAEDALNVLQQSGNESAYKEALAAYMSGLTMTKTAEKQSSCSMVIKSGSTQYPTCGHTGLPLHKVYQDEHGNCHPLYRKNMPEQTSSGWFNNYKILG